MNNQIKRGDVVYVDLTGNKGSEQGGIRPAIVIQNDVGNKFSPSTIIVPLTSQQGKKKMPTHIPLDSRICGLTSDSIALAEQVRTVDKTRLKSFVTTIPANIMLSINQAICVSMGLAM